jgi:hypothetical protein
MESYRESVMRGYNFEDFIYKVFKYYKVEDIKRDKDLINTANRPVGYDFYLNNKILVEVKVFTKRDLSSGQIIQFAKKMIEWNSKNLLFPAEHYLLIVGNVVNFDRLNIIMGKYPELKCVEIIDIRNLLYLIRKNDPLMAEITSLLNYSTEDMETIPPNLSFELFDEDKVEPIEYVSNKSYIEKLNTWIPNGRVNSSEFEKLCVDILKRLLNDNLMLWNDQQSSNENLYRFDLICKIKTESSHDFWNIIKNHFDTRYLIFEFKNYKDEITQKEIYTTEKYLYAKALRSVAIIISPKGEDFHSKKAINGTLRENGKLIISLKTADLVEMLDLQESDEGISPSDFLSDKLDNLLINLDK